MSVTLALAGDTMLGRGVAERAGTAPHTLFSAGVRDAAAEADLFVLNLECCISGRGEPWPAPGKRFHFRAPPRAVEALAWLGVDCVTLANNHALDFGALALTDTLDHLARAGIRVVGAGADVRQARAPLVLEAGGLRVGVVGAADHPADFAAGPTRPGIAYADLRRGIPDWLATCVSGLAETADVVLVSPHWGPNMTPDPVPHVRGAAAGLSRAGATLVAGHSAHVFHGVAGGIVYDLGDFIDDYATDPVLRNDLGLLVLVTLDEQGPIRLQAVPLRLHLGHTELARGADWRWIRARFTRACADLGTDAAAEEERLVVRWR